MFRQWEKFLKNESGATAIEYALIASLIAMSIIGGATVIGPEVGNSMQDAADGFN